MGLLLFASVVFLLSLVLPLVTEELGSRLYLPGLYLPDSSTNRTNRVNSWIMICACLCTALRSSRARVSWEKTKNPV
ncbi:hypothetical protein F5880DRAFT_49847 [Lentinula raphanica]|nr:hypothetical protein F5880DRAFT_49847 [Lentinula raphanica]